MMEEEVWFVVCAPDDCHSGIIGPLFSERDAQIEAGSETNTGYYQGCTNAHFVSQVPPPTDKKVVVPPYYHAMRGELYRRSVGWLVDHGYPSKERSFVLDMKPPMYEPFEDTGGKQQAKDILRYLHECQRRALGE